MNNLRNIFHFSTSERNGILVLLVILFFLIITPWVLDIVLVEEPLDYSEFEKDIVQNETSVSKIIKKNDSSFHYFIFDPNEITSYNGNF